jgi:hypothetical protein
MNINPAQLKRLQVLYGQYERHSLDLSGKSREERLEWASERVGRKIASFKDLSLDEGRKLIDTLQGILQVKAPSKTPRRRDQATNDVVLIGEGDLDRIKQQLTRLGWDQAQLERFLLGSRSPLKGRAQLRTLSDANRVYWALKHIPARTSGGVPEGKEAM